MSPPPSYASNTYSDHDRPFFQNISAIDPGKCLISFIMLGDYVCDQARQVDDTNTWRPVWFVCRYVDLSIVALPAEYDVI